MQAVICRFVKTQMPFLLFTVFTMTSFNLVHADTIAKSDTLTVYKSPSCGCCSAWVEHMQNAGFHTAVEHPNNLQAIKRKLGIKPQYQSCHTAVHNDFIFEGHIPVKFIQQFLDNPPKGAIGLSVPAMPAGSPGMEMGNRFTPYTIYQLQQDGTQQVFATVSQAKEQF